MIKKYVGRVYIVVYWDVLIGCKSRDNNHRRTIWYTQTTGVNDNNSVSMSPYLLHVEYIGN